ncbi:MAG: ATP-binding protein [Polyangiales bacterium]
MRLLGVVVPHTRSEGFEVGQRELLERIAKGAPLAELLQGVVRLIEAQAEGMLCSIVLVDREHGCIRCSAAPSLPEEYVRAIDGAPIGPEAGSCGAAAARGERVVVEDIETHPYWRDYKHLALPHGLRACWSSPIFAPDRTVLGTFAMYYKQPRRPSEEELAWVDVATHLAAIAIVRDQTEAAARASEKLRALIYESVTDVIFYLGVEPDGRFRFLSVNRAFSQATGLAEDQVLGKCVDEVIPEPSLSLVLAKYQQAIASREKVTWEEVTPYPSGVRYGEVAVAPIFDPSGRCTNLVGSVHDVTARKKAEEERHQLETSLHQAQRLQALGTLAGGIAHDFNNLIAGIRGYADIALLDPPESESLRECLQEIRAAGVRASDLVRRILTFSRNQEPVREPLSLQSVVEEALKLLRPTLLCSVGLETHFASDAPQVLADATQVHQIVVNLATNAAHAMAGREGSLRITLDSLRLDGSRVDALAGLTAGRYVRLCIADRGCGMDSATLARVFEPFFTTTPAGAGTGLGLSIVHGIMKSHEGAVAVESEIGRGTTFSLYFPVHENEVSKAEPKPQSARPGEHRHILYVDDDEALVHLGVRMLQRLGHRVTGHTDPMRALAELRERAAEFDALVADVTMPGLSGPDLALEALRLRPGLRVLLVSGYLAPEDIDRARRSGVQDVVLKPRTVEEFAAVLDRVLSASDARV